MNLRALFPALLLLGLPALHAQNGVRAGRLIVEPPTLINLGFEWEMTGDANRNATVEVRYRETGAPDWIEALPLLRIGGERVFRVRENLEYKVPDLFAGSILDVKPETEYECRFTMRDPDGVEGDGVQTVKVRTRGEPRAAQGGRVLHVYPPDWKGEKQEPSFTGLLQAYYGAGLGDWNVVWERRARPGDILMVHAGLYKADRLNYVDPLMTPFDGMYSLTLKGTPERPIVIRGAGDGEVIFDGNGCHRLFDVMASEYHIFEGLTIRNADIAIFAGQKEVLGAKGLTVRNCRMEDVGVGVTTEYAGSTGFYIADNVILGRDDHYRLVGWSNPGIYGAHPLRSYFGVKVYGSGHVVAYNAIAYFHDGICMSTYGTPDPKQKAVAIDFYNNDIHMSGDDFIETDGGVHNIRVMRNRGVNAAHGGLSAQPIFGGPVYFIRNVMYDVASGVAFKFSAKPAGLFVYHNTVISEHVVRDPHSNTHFRNNLFLGADVPGRGIATFANATPYSTFDYDGFRPNRDVTAQYTWLAQGYAPDAKDWHTFATLAELKAATGQEAHGMEVDYDIFENLRGPDGTKRHAVYYATDLDFRLKTGSKAVDAGVRLPTVNDDFSGRAPDLGALETGKPVPRYGPRGASKAAFYRRVVFCNITCYAQSDRMQAQLQRWRERNRLTQVEAAAMLGVSQPYLSLLEKGERSLTKELRNRLNAVLHERGQPGGEDRLRAQLSALGYSGFAHLAPARTAASPGATLLAALSAPDLDSRVSEALPWVARQYADHLDWPWLVRQAKLRNLQNRLGFLLATALELEDTRSPVPTAMRHAKDELEDARLLAEATFCWDSMPAATRKWLRENRSPLATHWNILSLRAPEKLGDAS